MLKRYKARDVQCGSKSASHPSALWSTFSEHASLILRSCAITDLPNISRYGWWGQILAPEIRHPLCAFPKSSLGTRLLRLIESAIKLLHQYYQLIASPRCSIVTASPSAVKPALRDRDGSGLSALPGECIQSIHFPGVLARRQDKWLPIPG